MVLLETVKTGTGPQVAWNSHSHRRYSENMEILHVLILSLIYEIASRAPLQNSVKWTGEKTSIHYAEMCLKTPERLQWEGFLMVFLFKI